MNVKGGTYPDSPDLVQGRIELTTLAIGRYKLRSTDIARVIEKHPGSIARWVKLGLLSQQDDTAFLERIDRLDYQISWSARNNA